MTTPKRTNIKVTFTIALDGDPETGAPTANQLVGIRAWAEHCEDLVTADAAHRVDTATVTHTGPIWDELAVHADRFLATHGGQKIQAIKALRDTVRDADGEPLGLKEAKAAIEAARTRADKAAEVHVLVAGWRLEVTHPEPGATFDGAQANAVLRSLLEARPEIDQVTILADGSGTTVAEELTRHDNQHLSAIGDYLPLDLTEAIIDQASGEATTWDHDPEENR